MLDPAGWNIPESGCPVGPPGTPGKRKDVSDNKKEKYNDPRYTQFDWSKVKIINEDDDMNIKQNRSMYPCKIKINSNKMKKMGYIYFNFTVIREFTSNRFSDELDLSYDTISKIKHDNNFICEKCSINHRFVSYDPCFVHLNHYEIDFKYVFKIPNKLLNSESVEKIIGDFLSSFEIPFEVTNISYTFSNKKGENE